jgi:quinol monooxygenase YgiN
MHTSLVISGLGAVVAAIGGGVLLARCFRQPRSDLIALSVALIGLLISLGSQTLGYVDGFDSAMFRAMELGGQVIAPLALVLALAEVGARSTPVRFCARLYIPSLAVVAIVVLALDQLAQTSFSKRWPNPAVFYGTPPNYVLEFAIGPATALVALLAVWSVARRSGQPGWNALLPPQLMGGAAALLLAYPALAELAAYVAKIHLPLSASVFSLACTGSAALTWLAGTRLAQLPMASRSARRDDGFEDDGFEAVRSYDGVDRTGDFARFEPATDGGVYRGEGLYRPDPEGRTGARGYERDHDAAGPGGPDGRSNGGYDESWRHNPPAEAAYWGDRDGWQSDQHEGSYQPDFATGDFVPGDYVTGDFAAGDVAGDDRGAEVGGWQGTARSGDRLEPYGRPDYADDRVGRAGRTADGQADAAEDPGRSQLFGQIAIYTLLEDRIEEFDQLTERVVDQVRSREPDTLVFIVHAVPSAPMQRILYEVYRDRSAYQWHATQPHVQQFEVDKRPYVLATNVIELGLQQAKVSPFPLVTELFSEPGYDTAGFERPDYLRDYGRPSAHPGGNTRDYR